MSKPGPAVSLCYTYRVVNGKGRAERGDHFLNPGVLKLEHASWENMTRVSGLVDVGIS